jgi:hypothetical protein
MASYKALVKSMIDATCTKEPQRQSLWRSRAAGTKWKGREQRLTPFECFNPYLEIRSRRTRLIQYVFVTRHKGRKGFNSLRDVQRGGEEIRPLRRPRNFTWYSYTYSYIDSCILPTRLAIHTDSSSFKDQATRRAGLQGRLKVT